MKFIWQQIIGILLVLMIALLLSGTLLENYLTHQIETSRQEQLLNYGENIVNNNFSRKDLVRTSQLLASENIVIQVYLSNGRIIYPTYNEDYNAKLSAEDLKKLHEDKKIGFRTIERLNDQGQVEPYLSVYLPHRNVGEFPQGFISLGAPLDGLQAQLTAVRRTIFVTFAISGTVAVILVVIYAYYQTSKIQRLQRATQKISEGNYEVDLRLNGQDEFSDLARDFQKMASSLVASEKEIARQEELRRQFMMDVAHEMRTPLTTMSGLMEGLIHNMIPENHRDRSMELIRDETERLTRLVNENLDYERIRSQQFVLNKTLINVQDLFAVIYDQMRLKAENKNNEIIYKTSDELMIWADHDRLQQILINLIANAIQFSENSNIELSAKEDKGGILISVSDEGIGIDSSELDRIWDRFYKSDISRTSTKFGESGIGLAVVQSLVLAHDGEIRVKSELGEGTTFLIWFPGKGEKS